MQIININADSKSKNFDATVKLNYNELRDLANILCEIERVGDWADKETYWKLRRDLHLLFDLVGNSSIDDWIFEVGYEMTQKMKKIHNNDPHGVDYDL